MTLWSYLFKSIIPFVSGLIPGIEGKERTRQNMKWRTRYHESTSIYTCTGTISLKRGRTFRENKKGYWSVTTVARCLVGNREISLLEQKTACLGGGPRLGASEVEVQISPDHVTTAASVLEYEPGDGRLGGQMGANIGETLKHSRTRNLFPAP